MTPLASAPPPVAPKAAPAPAQGRGAAGRESPETGSFAKTLERSAAATDAAGPDAAPDTPAPGDANGASQQPVGKDPAETATAPEPGSLAWAVQSPPPEPAWPPAGLAGLRLSPAGEGAPGITAAADGAPGAARGPALAPQPLAQAMTGALAASASAAMAEDGAPAPALAAITAAMATPSDTGVNAMSEGSEPAPAFALPTLAGNPPAAVRDVAPLLAPPANLPTPDLRGQDFSERFGAQLQWMAGQEIGHARIRISPQELGPVEVMLRLDGDRVSADFISAHAETRQALEQGLPRLRDLLGEHGFQLAHADVGSQGSSPQGDGADASASDLSSAGDSGGEASGQPASASQQRIIRGLLDAYA